MQEISSPQAHTVIYRMLITPTSYAKTHFDMNKLLAGPIIFSIRDSTPESELQINTSYILHTKIIYTSIRSSLISPAFMSNTIDYWLIKTKSLTT